MQIAERDEEKASLQRKVEDLQRKFQQGSQQLQGEVSNWNWKASCGRFPFDVIQPVAKGEFGGDVLERVMTHLSALRQHPLGVQAPRTGATPGCRNCEKTRGRPRRTWR